MVHTYQFLSRIPWTREFRRIPEIARSHHEKLDGTGYPVRMKAEEIPVQSKMMTIADIYDALTASDRPYKKGVPRDQALDILSHERRAGHLDGAPARPVHRGEDLRAGVAAGRHPAKNRQTPPHAMTAPSARRRSRGLAAERKAPQVLSGSGQKNAREPRRWSNA